MPKTWTREELKAQGITDEQIDGDRSNHPQALISSWDVTPQDKRVLGERIDYRFPHVRPQSVLVAAIGNTWDEGCWWRFQDMCLATAVAGHSVSLQEFTDPSIWPSDAIQLMRWSAAMAARDSGVEWLFMVDNDVMLEKDTLLKLMAWDMPVVFPILEDLEKKYPIALAPMSDPYLEPNHGLQPARWSAMSAMLFNPRIFNVLDSNAWKGTDYHFGQALNFIGHRIYVDTNTVVKVTRGPSRVANLSWDELMERQKNFRDKLRWLDRDRRPPPNFNPLRDDGWVDKHGTYYAVLNKVARGEQNGRKDGNV